ncbi:MAG: hypothetical protein KDD25_10045 [Bdellovibrionales bacterium]|nr:hypothetical protein [Bdellovibrionales bacterium]
MKLKATTLNSSISPQKTNIKTAAWIIAHLFTFSSTPGWSHVDMKSGAFVHVWELQADPKSSKRSFEDADHPFFLIYNSQSKQRGLFGIGVCSVFDSRNRNGKYFQCNDRGEWSSHPKSPPWRGYELEFDTLGRVSKLVSESQVWQVQYPSLTSVRIKSKDQDALFIVKNDFVGSIIWKKSQSEFNFKNGLPYQVRTLDQKMGVIDEIEIQANERSQWTQMNRNQMRVFKAKYNNDGMIQQLQGSGDCQENYGYQTRSDGKSRLTLSTVVTRICLDKIVEKTKYQFTYQKVNKEVESGMLALVEFLIEGPGRTNRMQFDPRSGLLILPKTEELNSGYRERAIAKPGGESKTSQ